MKSISARRREVRAKRKIAIRKKVSGTADRPRVSIFRSHKNIYAQLVNDDEGTTMLSTNAAMVASTEVPEELTGKCAKAYTVGRGLAEMAKEKGITAMVFDRSGYLYHGRIAALARGLRDGGVKV